jgi:glycosyltransferase involved in cell wall biosynthesis
MLSKIIGISTIIPSYFRDGNSLIQLKSALDSVARQTVPPDEIIVTDDSSPHDRHHVLGLLESFYQLDVTYLVNKNSKGVSGNSNFGILNSSNDYIHILHQDDQILDENFYNEAISLFQFGTNWIIAEGADAQTKILPRIRKGGLPSEMLLGINAFGSPSSTVFRKLSGLHFSNDLVMFADVDFYFKLTTIYGIPLILSGRQFIHYGTGEYQLQQSIDKSSIQAEIKMVSEKYPTYVNSAWFWLLLTKKHYRAKEIALSSVSELRRIYLLSFKVFSCYLKFRQLIKRLFGLVR